MTAAESAGPEVVGGLDLDIFRRNLALTREEVWVLYFGVGGTAGADRLFDYLAGASGLDRHQHNTLVQALNEQYVDRGDDHAIPYVESGVADAES